MKVLVVGNGAREHAIVWKLLLSPSISEVYVAPGNGGTAPIARNVEISPTDVRRLADFAAAEGIRLVVVGPEAPLAAGLVDELKAAGVPAFGPTRGAADLEASKVFAHQLMTAYGIPCPRAEYFDDFGAARRYVEAHDPPFVVKADGLAAGKGTIVAADRIEAIQALERIMVERVFGAAGERVLIQEFLQGREVSLLAFCDGEAVCPMLPACDYKRLLDGDRGPNTGGMGAYCPPSFFGPAEVELATRTILQPTVRAMAREGRSFVGVLYAGLMVTADGPKVLEFNVRFGDPEAQVILPLLRSDLAEVIGACLEGRLGRLKLEWEPGACVGVVLAGAGYPDAPSRGVPIEGLDGLEDGILVFHGGTRLAEAEGGYRLVTDGGRILTVVARGPTIAEARRKVYRNVERVRFAGMQFRRDIALREADPEELAGPSEDPKALDPPANLPVARVRPAEGPIPELEVQAQRSRGDPGAWVQLADACARAGLLEKAALAWAVVTQLAPNDARAFHNWGAVLLRLGRLKEARAAFNQAFALAPDDPEVNRALGVLCAAEGEEGPALAHFHRALRARSAGPEVYIDFADVLLRFGRLAEAGKILQEALTRPDLGSYRSEVEARLRKLAVGGSSQ
ncbi:MAG: phosphoribosylamine--glycine ligase [Chloroflexota bacterium]